MSALDTTKTSPQWRVKNKLYAVIMLPCGTEGSAVLPIGGEITVDETLLHILGDMVEVLGVDESPPVDQGYEQPLAQPEALYSGASSELSAVQIEFLTAWHRAYGGKFVKSAILLELAASLESGLLPDNNLDGHAMSIAMSKILKDIASTCPPCWSIKTRKRSNRTEYSIEATTQ